MNIHLITVGKAGNAPEADIAARYMTRMAWPVEVTEVEEKRPITGPERMKREADLILKVLPKGATLVLLDEAGKDTPSTLLANKMQTWQDNGVQTLAFVIGGADGLDTRLKERAVYRMAFGKQTWPHMMVRAMLMEQLYRAETIITGHPYHRA